MKVEPVEPTYDERGLVPCIVQDAAVGTVLMLAWMNAEALRLTRTTGVVHFWSRSRQALWKKGETSGHTLAVVELRLDCDLDAVLVRATPAGPTCHTGATSCFFHRDAGGPGGELTGELTDAPGDAPGDEIDDGPALPILHRLARIIEARRASPAATAEKSYTRSLLDAGMPKILAKIAEEHGELAAELPAGEDAKVIHETADLLFHVMVGLGARGIPIEAVLGELARRFGTSGHVEKARRT
ncbi:MAG TPA: bifunctional phosphoribosyl-AMP cyclohydrolase/phosphoribosyl-ATP diphosphatase HisIE [Kofleriaceae bacterium]|nr:bifunctional phosphoribosyl-AMP cyclohydrolase/phosphoribosyl-ATP diphosphatase HisIE [Kofleriaceae bacterium]